MDINILWLIPVAAIAWLAGAVMMASTAIDEVRKIK